MSDIMLAWIQYAINVEKAGYEFYKVCLKKIEDQRAQELFKWLVDEEIKHEKALKELRMKKAGNDEAKGKKSIEEYSKMGIEIPMFNKEALEKMTDKNTMVMETFNMAAAQEKTGIQLYLDLEEKQDDPEMKEFFHDLALQELRHRKRIVNVSMSLLGMEPEEEETTKEKEEQELHMQKTIIREVEITAKACEFTPRDITVNKGETIVLKINAVDSPAGFRCINFQLNEYISPGKPFEVKFLADTAGEFEFFSNVPCATGTEKMRGKFIIEGENEPDEDL
jgi:rubrerythrin